MKKDVCCECGHEWLDHYDGWACLECDDCPVTNAVAKEDKEELNRLGFKIHPLHKSTKDTK